MPATYIDATIRITDTWVAGLNRAAQALPKLRANVDAAYDSVPDLVKPLTVAPLRVPGVPAASEVITANFAATERVLDAQRDLALAFIDAVSYRRAK